MAKIKFMIQDGDNVLPLVEKINSIMEKNVIVLTITTGLMESVEDVSIINFMTSKCKSVDQSALFLQNTMEKNVSAFQEALKSMESVSLNVTNSNISMEINVFALSDIM